MWLETGERKARERRKKGRVWVKSAGEGEREI